MLIAFFGCGADKRIIYVAYHPYIAKKLCKFYVSGDLTSVQSIKILLDKSNIIDYDDNIHLQDKIIVNPNEEFPLPYEPGKKEFQYNIPCRIQIIRIRYEINREQKFLDIKYDSSVANKIRISRSKFENVLYEKK